MPVITAKPETQMPVITAEPVTKKPVISLKAKKSKKEPVEVVIQPGPDNKIDPKKDIES